MIMVSKALLSSFCVIILSSLIHPGFSSGSSNDDLDQLLGGLAHIAAIQDTQCMHKLLPCQEILSSPNPTANNPPPAACCAPLNDMIKNETKCICNFINNPKLLASMNVAKDDLLKLPRSCGLKVNISSCEDNNTASSSPPSPSSPLPADLASLIPKAEAPAPTAKASTSSTKMITPYGITHFGVPGFVAVLTALVFSTF